MTSLRMPSLPPRLSDSPSSTYRGQVSNLNPTLPGQLLQSSPMSRPAAHRVFRRDLPYDLAWFSVRKYL